MAPHFLMRSSHAMPLTNRRLLIVEEALQNYTGHWYEYDRAVTEFNRAAGVEVTVAAHRTVDPEIAAELNANPLFRYTNWDGVYYSPSAWRRYLGILKHNWYVYRTLDSFLAESEGYDCIFVPTVVIYHWIAWLGLISKYHGRKFTRLVLFIRNNAGTYPNGTTHPVFQRHMVLLKKVLQAYQKWIQAGVVCLGTDSARHAAEYKLLAGLEVKVFPHPKVQLPTLHYSINSNRLPDAPVVFSCLGPARLEKGTDIFQEAILHLVRTKPNLNAKFVIQWNRDIIKEDGAILERSTELNQSGKVLFLTQDLTSDEYNTYLGQSDCIVLPYRRESYYTRLSGIAIEAAMLGIPLIYTRHTWLEDAVSQYGAGLGVNDQDPINLAEMIALMAASIDQYRASAQQRASLARAYHSSDHFLECLWGL